MGAVMPSRSDCGVIGYAVRMRREIDKQAERALESMRERLVRARELEASAGYAAAPGDLGREGYLRSTAAAGLQNVEYLRNLGAPWLSQRPEWVQTEVNAAESELRRLLGVAASFGATMLPKDLPPDPFVTGNVARDPEP